MKPIGGTKHVKTFIIKRGQTYLATKHLKIIAKGKIEIDGSLMMAPGAGVSLVAGKKLIIRGSIMPAPMTGAAMALSDPRQVGSAHDGATVDLQGFSVTVEIDSKVDAENGSNGTPGHPDGYAGGNVHIFGKGYGATVSGTVHAGRGGDGAKNVLVQSATSANACHENDHVGKKVVKGGDGGRGGTVYIHSRALLRNGVDLADSDISAGDGGDGGSVSADSPDGSADHAGTDLEGRSGSGGRGGEAYFISNVLSSGKVTQGDAGFAGQGGDRGLLSLIAGNGGVVYCDGGSIVAVLGLPGAAGKRGRRPPARHPLGLAEVSVTAGNGEPSDDSTHPGGFGGNVEVHDPNGKPVVLTVGIDVLGGGNGGHGWSDCQGGTIEPGTAGGQGGVLTVHGSHIRRVALAFNGARGGDGHPPGDGGVRGSSDTTPDSSTGSFKPGDPGNDCPPKTQPPPKPKSADGFGLLLYDRQSFDSSFGMIFNPALKGQYFSVEHFGLAPMILPVASTGIYRMHLSGGRFSHFSQGPFCQCPAGWNVAKALDGVDLVGSTPAPVNTYFPFKVGNYDGPSGPVDVQLFDQTGNPSGRFTMIEAQPGVASLMTDLPSYPLGNEIFMCFTTPQPGTIVKITLTFPDATKKEIFNNQVPGPVGCTRLVAGGSPGPRQAHLDALSGSTVIGSADTSYTVTSS